MVKARPMSSSEFSRTWPEQAVGASTWQKILQVKPSPVSDILHSRGYHNQVMRHGIQPLDGAMPLAGIARTMLSRPLVGEPVAGKEYELLFDAIDTLRPGEVLVTDEMNCCVWGELCSEVAAKKGGNGIVVDGFSRDVEEIKKLGFPVYCRGSHMSDMLYHRTITGVNEPVMCSGVAVWPGDLILGSEDGVVVVPAAIIDEVIKEAYAKTQTESAVRRALREGMSVKDTYKKYGVM
jgi:4-hydroxy-4-methyl-2-oxoglutarate aldolase